MKKSRLFIFSVVLLVGLSTSLHAEEIIFQWFGQACYFVQTSQNTKIIIDPVLMELYKVPQDIEPDIVTVSHEHFDHNMVDAVSGKPVVLKGLSGPIDKKVKDIHIYSVSSFHDDSKGSQRGGNAIFVFEFDGIRMVHLGDLGHILSDEQVKKIGAVDILMIPVGGTYTIFGQSADKVISQLKPRMIVFPMHFKTDAADFLPYTADDFTSGKPEVKKVSGNTYTLDLNNSPKTLTYVILDYK